ncbi:diphthine synthase [Candidatus Pacearchaeota archaeon]|jgi:diphthine synthase|nr:diphthine synthase [Candidatus Pacearchaeota archaeon]
MLYLIGLGLNEKSLSKEAIEIIKRCKKVYLEDYTVDFPYTHQALIDEIGKKFVTADREKVESLEIVDEAKKMDVALLVYGSPLTATTHITLIEEAILSGIKYRIINNASVLDGIVETGLQIYKFGKITSLPEWKKSYEPDSFMEIVKENQSIKAHTLLLVDIGLDIKKAIEQLEKAAKKHNFKLFKLIICQALGTKKQKIIYKDLEKIKEFTNVQKPYCIIIPGELHFMEKKMLEGFS